MYFFLTREACLVKCARVILFILYYIFYIIFMGVASIVFRALMVLITLSDLMALLRRLTMCGAHVNVLSNNNPKKRWLFASGKGFWLRSSEGFELQRFLQKCMAADF